MKSEVSSIYVGIWTKLELNLLCKHVRFNNKRNFDPKIDPNKVCVWIEIYLTEVQIEPELYLI